MEKAADKKTVEQQVVFNVSRIFLDRIKVWSKFLLKNFSLIHV